jgi:hypothetical protein
MSDRKSSLLKSAMNGGVLTGGILILSFLFLLLFNFGGSVQILFILFVLGICNYSLAKKYRDKELEGKISYEKSLGFGLLVSLFGSIIIAFIIYVELNFMQPAVFDHLIETMRLQYIKMGYTKLQVDTILQMMTPKMISFIILIFFTFLGFVSSLFSSMIVKNGGNTFNDTMKHIE